MKEFTQRKREKIQLLFFFSKVGKLVVVTVENQTSPITKVLVVIVVKVNFHMKYWLLLQHISEWLLCQQRVSI